MPIEAVHRAVGRVGRLDTGLRRAKRAGVEGGGVCCECGRRGVRVRRDPEVEAGLAHGAVSEGTVGGGPPSARGPNSGVTNPQRVAHSAERAGPISLVERMSERESQWTCGVMSCSLFKTLSPFRRAGRVEERLAHWRRVRCALLTRTGRARGCNYFARSLAARSVPVP